MQRTIFCDKQTHEQNKMYTDTIIGAYFSAPSEVFDFFCHNISTIRQNIDSCSSTAPPGLADQLFSGKPLTHFSAVSETAVSALLKKMACKTCDLDPILTSLLFDCSNEILPALTHVVNESLLSGTFPTVFKHFRLTQMI